jgi:hypothetical protein
MPTAAESQSRAIGFLNPYVVRIHIIRGEKFKVRGILADGLPYELRHEIVDIDQTSITLSVEGEFGINNKLHNKLVTFNLIPNQPFDLSQGIFFGQPKISIAFIALSALQFQPKVGGALTLALGEVRDTAPPKKKKKK